MNKILFVGTEYLCNNRCYGCAIPEFKARFSGSTADVIKRMRAGKDAGYRNVHFIGGEPTIQPDFFRLLDAAHALFSEIYLTTNGRMFSYGDFAQRVAQYPKIKTINVSLHGHTAKIHEAWTRTPGSFRQTVRGIRNILKHKKNVCANIIVWKGNYRYIPAYLRCVKKLGVCEAGILNLVPAGRAKKYYHSMVVRLPDMHDVFLCAAEELNGFLSVDIEDFPVCVVGNVAREMSDKVHIQNISTEIFLGEDRSIETYGIFMVNELGYSVESNLQLRKNHRKIKQQLASMKIKTSLCKTCEYSERCGGILNAYVLLRGKHNVENELRNIAYNTRCHANSAGHIQKIKNNHISAPEMGHDKRRYAQIG